MNLPDDMARCQGKTARAFGSATLCRPCVDCQRRTSPASGDLVQWVLPPKFLTGYGYADGVITEIAECPIRIGADEVVA
jgi:hypothetical protein